MADIASDAGCDALSFSPFKTPGHQLSSHLLSVDETRQVCSSLLRMKRRLESLGISHNIDAALLRYRIGGAVWERFPCYIGWFHARIRHDGAVFPCVAYTAPLGSLHRALRPLSPFLRTTG